MTGDPEPCVPGSTVPDMAAVVLRPGEHLLDRRYRIVEVISSDPRCNVYRAVDLARRRCPECLSPDASVEDERCPRCDRSLGDAPVDHPTCRLEEVADPANFPGAGTSPGEDVAFAWTPYGSLERHYRVSDVGEESLPAGAGGSPGESVAPDPVHLVLSAGLASDVGQVREINEDALMVADVQVLSRSQQAPVGVYAVADGMGGHSAGEVASGIVVDAIARSAPERLLRLGVDAGASPAPDPGDALVAVCQAASEALFEARRASESNMGATLVAALVVGLDAYVASAGDSRAYHVSPAGITQLTTDHSLVQRWVDLGQITPEDARTHPRRNLIYRQVGEEAATEFDLVRATLRVGDWLVLCSDGLSGALRDAEIHAVVTCGSAPQAVCDDLVRRANDAGGEDNITVVAVLVRAVPDNDAGGGEG